MVEAASPSKDAGRHSTRRPLHLQPFSPPPPSLTAGVKPQHVLVGRQRHHAPACLELERRQRARVDAGAVDQGRAAQVGRLAELLDLLLDGVVFF